MHASRGVAEGLVEKVAGIQFAIGEAPAGTIQATVFYLEWKQGFFAPPITVPSKMTAQVQFSNFSGYADMHQSGQQIGYRTAKYMIATTQ